MKARTINIREHKITIFSNTIYEFLFFIVPPERICIKDESGTERTSVVGPYSEGDIVKLKCDVFGGECNSTEKLGKLLHIIKLINSTNSHSKVNQHQLLVGIVMVRLL